MLFVICQGVRNSLDMGLMIPFLGSKMVVAGCWAVSGLVLGRRRD